MLDVIDRPGVSRIEGEEGIAEDVLGFATEFLRNDLGELFAVELVDGTKEAEDEDVLASGFGVAAVASMVAAVKGTPMWMMPRSSLISSTWSES